MNNIRGTIKNSPKRGRPRDSRREVEILQAAIRGLEERGYDQLSITEIANRAHASKSTIYRRWKSKAELISDAVAYWLEGTAPLAVPDKGSLAEDIATIISAVPDYGEAFRTSISRFLSLASAAAREEELRPFLSHQVIGVRRSQLCRVLENAKKRGEISRTSDMSLVPDMVIGLILVHMLTDKECDNTCIRHLVESVIYPFLISTEPS